MQADSLDLAPHNCFLDDVEKRLLGSKVKNPRGEILLLSCSVKETRVRRSNCAILYFPSPCCGTI